MSKQLRSGPSVQLCVTLCHVVSPEFGRKIDYARSTECENRSKNRTCVRVVTKKVAVFHCQLVLSKFR